MKQISLCDYLQNKLNKCELRIDGLDEGIERCSQTCRNYDELKYLIVDHDEEIVIRNLLKELITDCKNGKFIEIPKMFSEM